MSDYTSENYFVNPAHRAIAKSRYYLKDQEGNVVERDIFEVFDRVNSYVFQNDPAHKAEMQRLCEEKKFMYAGRPLAQAGTGIKNMFNCFVLGIGDSREEISECQRIHFHVQAHGGGTGINFSKLRPSGSWCKGANARSSGPEGFITAMGYLSSNIQQGGNRCLPGDARVSMADGSWKNIDQVRPGDRVLVFDKSSRRVVTSEVLNFFENGIQDVYEYTLTSGKKVRSTDTHRWLGQQTDGTLLVRTVKDMPHSSTKIGFAQELPFFGSKFSEWSPILGYLLGDGCFTGDQIKLSFENNEIRNRFVDSIPSEFSYWENAGSVFITSGGKLEDYLRRTGLYRCLAHEKFIPEEVFSYRKEDLVQIVEGLIATDGWVTEEEIGYCSTSESLVRDFSLLLTKFGISGYIQVDNRPRKGQVRRPLWSLRIKHPRFYNLFHDTFNVPGKVGIKKDEQGIRTHLSNGINFYGVKEIRNLGPDLTYCIEVDHPDHLFIVDGAISHNSGANMGILEDWHPGLLKFVTKKSRGNWENIRKFAVVTDENQFNQWQWMNPYPWQTFNVSVALSDDFMRQVKRQSKKPWKLHWGDVEWPLWDFEVDLFEYLSDGETIKTTMPITVCAPDEEVAVHEAQNEVPFRNTTSLRLVNGPYHMTALKWFEKICTNAWEDGCPGIFFIDRARAYHNGEYFNRLEATNPCYAGDQHLLTSKGYITFEELYKSQEKVELVQDARVQYIGPEKDNNNPNYWKLFPDKTGYVFNTSDSPVFLTKKSAQIIKVTTVDGLEVRCTPDHHMAVIGKGMVEAGDLLPDDKIMVADTPLVENIDKTSLDYIIGTLCGLFLGDGHLNTSNTSDKVLICLWGNDRSYTPNVEKMIQQIYDGSSADLTSGGNGQELSPYFTSSVPDRNEIRINSTFLKKVFEGHGIFDGQDKYHFTHGNLNKLEFFAGLFSGLFFTDGTVCYSKSNGNLSIRFCSSRPEMLKQLQREALVFGSLGRVYKRRTSQTQEMPDGKGGKAAYYRKDSYELIFSGLARDRLVNLMDLSGEKSIKYAECRSTISTPYRAFWSKVKSIVPDGIEDVYCIAENNRRTVVVNGLTGRRCAEQILPEWSVCCLSSVVLPEFVTEEGDVNWQDLKNAVYLGVRALNHISELNETGIPQIDKNTKLERRIGLGTIGLAEMLIRAALRSGKDLRYSNDEGRAFAKKVLKFIKHSAYEASIELSKEIGPFPAYDFEQFKKSKFIQQLLKERPDLEEPLRKHGIANVTILTQAPTGTTGTITGYSSGCEPYFAMAYQRNSNVGTIMDGCPSFIDWLEEKEINYSEFGFSLKELRKHKRIPKVFEEAQDISWKDHLAMQAVFAEQVDSSVSKTINLPNSASVEDIMQAYIGAYDMDIKSTAVYRDGSKTQILEHLKSTSATKEHRPGKIVTMGAPERPEELPCDIHTVSVKGEKWKVLVGLLHGRPYETFCFPENQIELPSSKSEGTLIRNGGGKYKLLVPYGEDELIIKDVASFLLTDEHRMITRLLSTSLRHGAPLPALVSQLTKCDGEVTTFSKALMRVLRKYITDEEFIAASTCTQCQSLNLVLEEGCMKCGDCGFSACS